MPVRISEFARYNKAMTDQTNTMPVWNLDTGQWNALTGQVEANGDALEDGAFARPDHRPETEAVEIGFYATALNKPEGWNYPFLEAIPDSRQSGAFVGRAWHQPETGFVQFEVALPAAAQALAADYESGASDLDFVTYEQAVEQAMRGTPAEMAWLHREFGRLVNVTNL